MLGIHPNQVWCVDITYAWVQGHWPYLASVLHWYTRQMLDWACSVKPDAELLIETLDMAYEILRQPQQVLFRSDQVSQYASHLGHKLDRLGQLPFQPIQEDRRSLVGDFNKHLCSSSSRSLVQRGPAAKETLKKTSRIW